MFTRVETIFYTHLVLTGRLSTHLDSLFTKNPVFALPNTLAARIFIRVENRQLTLKDAARVYPDCKQKYTGPSSLPYKHPGNEWKSTSLNYCYYYYYYYYFN